MPETGRRPKEIEISPAMISAGAEIVAEYSPYENSSSAIAEEAFRAMLRASEGRFAETDRSAISGVALGHWTRSKRD
jgi:hypothetical protein